MCSFSQKNEVHPDIDLNIVMVHGVWSDGSAFDKMAEKFKSDERLKGISVKVSVVKYGKLLLSVGRIPFVRDLVSDYIAARLATCSYKYPKAKTVVLAHSFGTWAIARAVRDLYSEFRLNAAILVGSVVARNFDWSPYNIQVHNFVGKRDPVVLSSALWGTGWSGRFGFNNDTVSDNVTQYFMDWDHNDYPKGYDQYVEVIRSFVSANSGKGSLRRRLSM